MSNTTNASSVTVTDDRGRIDLATEVDDSMRTAYFMAHGTPFPANVTMLPQRDRQGRQMQEKAPRDIVYEGSALKVAINRAKRWMRSGKPGTPRRTSFWR